MVVGRLVVDSVRRLWPIGLLIAIVPAFWFGQSVTFRFAASMSYAFLFGPLFTSGDELLKVRRLLPASRRERWLARVITGTFFATLFSMTAALGTGFSGVALLALDAFASAGAAFGLLALAPAISRWLRTPDRRMVEFVAFMSFVGGAGWPFLWREDLPTTWQALTPAAIVLLSVGLALAAVAFVHTPPVVADSRTPVHTSFRRIATSTNGGPCLPPSADHRNLNGETPVRPADPDAGSSGPRAAFRNWRSLSDELTGVHLVVWRECRLVARVICAALVIDVMYRVVREPSFASILPTDAIWPFALKGRAAGDGVFWAVWLIALVVRTTIFPSRIMRQMRTLPLSTTQVTLMLLGQSALWLTMPWLVLLVIGVVADGHPAASLGPESFVLLLGLVALTMAIARRWPPALMLFVFGSGLVEMITASPTAFTPARVVGIGIVALAAAAWLNRYLLTRTSFYDRRESSAVRVGIRNQRLLTRTSFYARKVAQVRVRQER